MTTPDVRGGRAPSPRTPLKRRGMGIASFLIVVAVAAGVLSPASASANASSQPTLTIASLSSASQPSGSAFNYRVTFGCSNVNADPCAQDPVIRIPLGAAAGMPVDVTQDALIQSWNVEGDELVIALTDLTQGTSGSIDFRIIPPNRVTPDGTQWTLTPTMSFSDDTPAVSAPSVSSVATARPTLNVQKSADFRYYRAGDLVTYSISWNCAASNGSVGTVGVEDLDALVLTDTLPAGLAYVSSVPSGATVSGQSVTIALTAAQVGETCSLASGSAAIVRITARIDATVPDATVLGNTVTAQGTSIGGAAVIKEGDADITVVTALPGAGVSKSGYGPLANTVGDSAANDPNATGIYRSATYPGAWLGRGVAATVATSKVSLAPDTAVKNSARIEGLYQIRVTNAQPSSQFSLVDPVPCTTNVSGRAYESYAAGGELCTDPAFHVTLVTIDTQFSTGNERVGIPSGVTVKARLVDGSVIDLDSVFQEWSATNGLPLTRTYRVPDSAVGKVAEIVIPRADGMTNNVTSVVIGGYVDADREAGDLVRNQGEVASYLVGDQAPFAVTPTGRGTIYVVEGPQVGINKTWNPGVGEFRFVSDVALSGATTGDLTFTDTLPSGWMTNGALRATVYGYSSATWTTLTPVVSTTADPATGNTRLTLTVPSSVVNSLLRAGGLGERFRFEINVPAKAPGPGTFENTAVVNLSDPATQQICTQGRAVPSAAAQDFSCSSLVRFTIQPPNGSAGVQVTKSVKGSNDSGFKTFPAIGSVDGAGGTATFRLAWTNRGAASLDRVVLYDLLPRVGDTGTIPTTMEQLRGSTFQPTLTSISALPSAVTAFYSVSENPCRPEVLPDAQNPGCVDDWTAMPAAPGGALLSSILALKFVSSATHAFNTSFTVDINMTTPAGLEATDVAWNTFASAQRNVNNGQQVPVVESAKVGVAHEDFAHITIDKIVDRETARVGDVLTYTVTAVNDGGSDLSDVTLRDTLPDGVEFVSATSGGIHAAGSVTWQLPRMPLGQVFTFTVKAKIVEGNDVEVTDAGAVLVNRWGVDGEVSVTPLHPCPAPNEARESCATTRILGALMWTKISESGALLSDSRWTLQALDQTGSAVGEIMEIDDCASAPCAGADQDAAPGSIQVDGLTPGAYRLIEVQAPSGYVLDDTSRSVTVLASTRVTVLEGIVNEQRTVPVIPLTGGMGTTLFVSIAAGAFLALLTLLVVRRRSRRHAQTLQHSVPLPE